VEGAGDLAGGGAAAGKVQVEARAGEEPMDLHEPQTVRGERRGREPGEGAEATEGADGQRRKQQRAAGLLQLAGQEGEAEDLGAHHDAADTKA